MSHTRQSCWPRLVPDLHKPNCLFCPKIFRDKLWEVTAGCCVWKGGCLCRASCAGRALHGGTSTQTAARPRQGAQEQLFLLSSHQLLLSPPPINLRWLARPVPHNSSVIHRHNGQLTALNLSGLPVAALTATTEQGRRCLQTRETTDLGRYGYGLVTRAEGNPGSCSLAALKLSWSERFGSAVVSKGYS